LQKTKREKGIMELNELQENTEHAHHSGEKAIGLTTAIVAVLLAVATLLSHRAHTEEVKLQTQVNDQWGFYQAKHGRAHEYGALAEVAALLPNGRNVAFKDLKISIEEECGAPVEKGCGSPVIKGSPVLQQLLADEKSGTDAKPAAESSSSGSGASEKLEKREKSSTRESGTKEGATHVQERAREMEHETQLIEQKANYYDGAELFLEISIVLCSIALLAESRMYWKLSFISTAVGIAVAVWGLLLR
jgi:hypothetical protein